MVAKYEHIVDFHHIVDFVEASHIRYALIINPTVYVSHIRQFWSTARIKTTDEGIKILATVDDKPKTISESSIRKNLKLKDEAGIGSLPDAELFKNLTLMGYNISPNQKFTFQKASQEVKKDVSSLRYIAFPSWAHDALLEFSSSKPQDHCSTKVPEGSGNPNPTASTSNPPAD
nr:hypothetical protein [Tanacetum cinerariifolium]